MADLEQLYAQLASGESPTLQPHEQVLLLSRAERAARSASVDERMGGLRAAATLGGRDGWTVVVAYARDSAVVVRRFALDLAVGAKADGLAVMRELVNDPDEKIAVEALRRLTVAADKAVTTKARTLLVSSSARVRAAALLLLGNVAGPVVRREVGGLMNDPDPEVRRNAIEAIARIENRLARRAAGVWWDPAALAELEAEIATAQANYQAAHDAEATRASRADSHAGADLPVPKALPGPDDGRAGLPRPPPPSALPPPSSPISASRGPTPVEAAEQLRRFARATADERASMIPDLQKTGDLVLAAAQRLRLPGTDPELGRGAALAARHLEITSWASSIRRMLSDPDAGVRAEAAEAMGSVGRGMAIMTALAAVLTDRDPLVRAAAVRGLGALGKTLSRPDLVRQRLLLLQNDASTDVQQARDLVLAALDKA